MGARPMRILIVDPNEDVATALAARLERQGYAVFRRSLGVDALDCLREGSPELVISAFELPDCPTLEFLEAAGRIAPSVPIIVVGRETGSGERDLIDEVEYLLESATF